MKLVVFGPMILFFLFFLALVIGFFVLVSKLIKKGKDSFWVGKVIDKKHNQKRDFDTNRLEDYYYLVVQTDDGKELKLGMSRQKYDEFSVGDKLKKEKGKLFPEKI